MADRRRRQSPDRRRVFLDYPDARIQVAGHFTGLDRTVRDTGAEARPATYPVISSTSNINHRDRVVQQQPQQALTGEISRDRIGEREPGQVSMDLMGIPSFAGAMFFEMLNHIVVNYTNNGNEYARAAGISIDYEDYLRAMEEYALRNQVTGGHRSWLVTTTGDIAALNERTEREYQRAEAAEALYSEADRQVRRLQAEIQALRKQLATSAGENMEEDDDGEDSTDGAETIKS